MCCTLLRLTYSALHLQSTAFYHRSKNESKEAGGSSGGFFSLLRRKEVKSDISLPDTLQKFGSPTFDAQNFVRAHYSQHNPSHAKEHAEELSRRRELTREAMRKFVAENYTSFIRTSKEVVAIESDMIKLATVLNNFKRSMTVVQTTSFSHRDDSFMSVQKEYDRIQAARESGVQAQASSLEQFGEDIRSLIFERKFGPAVDLIESALQRGELRLCDIHADPVVEAATDIDPASAYAAPGLSSTSTSTLDLTALSRRSQADGGILEDASLYGPRRVLGRATSSSSSSSSSSLSPSSSAGGGGKSSSSSSISTANIPSIFKTGSSITPSSSSSSSSSSSPSLALADPVKPSPWLAFRAAREHIYQYIRQLIDSLTADLNAPTLNSFERKQLIGYLSRLGQQERAVRAFLGHRSLQIRTEARQVKFQGDVASHVHELSQVIFSSIGNALTEFTHLFADKALLASFTAWAVDEVEGFVAMFSKHVFQSEDMFGKVGKCLKYAYSACIGLEQQGLRFAFVLGRLLHAPLVDALKRNFRHAESLAAAALGQEQWIGTDRWVHAQNNAPGAAPGAIATAAGAGAAMANTPGAGAGKDGESKQGSTSSTSTSTLSSSSSQQPQQQQAVSPIGSGRLRLTDSAKYLYDAIRRLLRELIPILDNPLHPFATHQLYATVTQGTIRLLDGYRITMLQSFKHGLTEAGSLDDLQLFSIVANTMCLAEDLIPRVLHEYSRQFQRPVVELVQCRDQFARLADALQDVFSQKRSTHWVRGRGWTPEKQQASADALLAWVDGAVLTRRYAKCEEIPADPTKATVSKEWRDLALYLASLQGVVAKTLGQDAVQGVLTYALQDIMSLLHEPVGWERLSLTLAGAQQLVLDMRWLVAANKSFASPSTKNLLESVCRRVVRVHVASDPALADLPKNKIPDRTPLIVKSQDYYEAVAAALPAATLKK